MLNYLMFADDVVITDIKEYLCKFLEKLKEQ